MLLRAREAELPERDGVAIGEVARGFLGQAVMRLEVPGIERGEAPFDELRHHRDAGREFRRHGRDGALEGHEQADAPPLGDRFLDHRLIGLEDRHGREVARAGLDAGAEGGAGEQDAIRPGARRIAREREEAFRHARREPPFAREVRREAVIQQVHQDLARPEPREGRFDRRGRMAERMDQRDAPGRVHRLGLPQRRRVEGISRQFGKAISSGPTRSTSRESGPSGQPKP